MLRIYHSSDLDSKERSRLMRRSYAEDRSAMDVVREIIDVVERDGESAVRSYAKQFDSVELGSLLAGEDEFDEAEAALSSELKAAFRRAHANIQAFHAFQRETLQDRECEVDGARLGFRYRPVNCAGIYVPGGKASYPSSVLMGLIPARIAGVASCYLVTPSDSNGKVDSAVLYAARLSGADLVLKVGGAHGVAAAAFGIGVPRAEVVAGPGNRYVTAAKALLTGRGVIRMDLPAGPSEVIVIADRSARADFIASDLLSQAEHGEDSPAVLLTDSEELAHSVAQEIERGIRERPKRAEMKSTSIRDHSFAIVFEDLKEAFVFSNDYAPEHLEICTENPRADLDRVTAAGSVFLGHYAPVALGDYYSGTNHVLPTGGAGRFYSGLGVETFMKRITYQHPTRESLLKARNDVLLMSEHEGLDQEHGHSVAIRFKD